SSDLRAERRCVETDAAARAEREHPRWCAVALRDRGDCGVQCVVDLHAGVLGVVEPGAPQLRVLERESERPHQVQARAAVRAQADGVAGVGRGLRLVQDDVEQAGPAVHEGSGRPRQSRKAPLSSAVAPATTRSMPATESATGTVAFSPPISVRAQPGCNARTTMPRGCNACASSAVTMFWAHLLMS